MRSHVPLSRAERRWRDKHLKARVPEKHYTPMRLVAGQTLMPRALSNVGHGFDISSYQPAAPDFTAGGRRVAAWKATEATSYFDPHFAANRARAQSQQLVARIVYHFARPASSSGTTQALYLLGKIGARQRGEVIALDYEVGPWSVQWIVDFITTCHQHGWPTIFYSYLGMLSANPTAGIPETGCALWPAAYGTREPGDDRWGPYGGKIGWQHTDGSSSVPGNDGPWDCSQWDLARLAALAGSSSPPAPTPTPQPQGEEPVGAFALAPLGPGQTYAFRPPPANHSGGIPFGDVWISFPLDTLDAVRKVPLRVAVFDGKQWDVLHDGASVDPATGDITPWTPALPPLIVDSDADVPGLHWDKSWRKGSLVHCGPKGVITPLVEYVAG